jgi:hypothetical protein
VLVDPDLLEEVLWNKDLCVNNCGQEHTIIQSLLRGDVEGSFPHIDYFREMHGDPWPGHDGHTLLTRTSPRLRSSYRSMKENRRVFEKHTWLKDYHVRTMQTL